MRITLAIILLLVATVAFAGSDAPWVDMAGCPICTNVSSIQGLMETMTWEHHKTATGVMTVSTFSPEFQPQFAQAKVRMKKLLGQVVAGEAVEVCDYCSSIASLLNGGAKAENMVTSASDILLISSTDEATIARIHAHAQKTIDFLEAKRDEHHD